jgi:hypothetical protein
VAEDRGPSIPQSIEAVLAYLAQELPQLMQSGENWQVVLHGGRNGDVIVEQVRKATVVRREVKPPR